jgi:hypothetical protein
MVAHQELGAGRWLSVDDQGGLFYLRVLANSNVGVRFKHMLDGAAGRENIYL